MATTILDGFSGGQPVRWSVGRSRLAETKTNSAQAVAGAWANLAMIEYLNNERIPNRTCYCQRSMYS